MRPLAVAPALLIALLPSAAARAEDAGPGVAFLDGTFDDALKAAGRAGKLVFVDFYTDT
jgi:hypothetical protein